MITLPGDIPGLLRRCSPVVGNFPGAEGFRGTIGAVEGPRVWVADSLDKHAAWLMIEETALDLTDATGRAHAAWWLAEKVGLAKPSCVRWGAGESKQWVTGLWFLNGAENDAIFIGRADQYLHDKQHEIPGIDRLNRHDPPTLPDGSRWVDAEALRRVCLHVAGRTT